jgi:hypothetical protein
MSSPLKVRIDKDNQLNIKREGEKNYRKIPGIFKIDDNNHLIYQIRGNFSRWYKEYGLKNKIVFTGRWTLDSEHQLVLRLHKSKRFSSKYLRLSGKIFKVDAENLFFKINSRIQDNLLRVSMLKLRGIWKNDIFNRLIFEVKRKTNPEILIFRNAWQINPNHHIEYVYENKKTTEKNTIIFKGFWEMSAQNKLIYYLEGSSTCFNFKAGVESLSLYPRKGTIKYRLTIGLKKHRETKILIFQGETTISRTHKLSLQINYGKRMKRVNFNYRLTRRKRGIWLLTLITEKGKPLGTFISYHKNPFKGANYSYYARVGKRKGFEIRAGLELAF